MKEQIKEVPDSTQWVWVAEIQTSVSESVVGAYEPKTDSYCNWLKIGKNFMWGHYGFKNRSEMLKDLVGRV